MKRYDRKKYGFQGHYRPNKQAAGMTATGLRSKHWDRSRLTRTKADSAEYAQYCRLVVRGTLDTLRGYYQITERTACPCCGGKAAGKIRLNKFGKARLARLKRQKGVTP